MQPHGNYYIRLDCKRLGQDRLGYPCLKGILKSYSGLLQRYGLGSVLRWNIILFYLVLFKSINKIKSLCTKIKYKPRNIMVKHLNFLYISDFMVLKPTTSLAWYKPVCKFSYSITCLNMYMYEYMKVEMHPSYCICLEKVGKFLLGILVQVLIMS